MEQAISEGTRTDISPELETSLTGEVGGTWHRLPMRNLYEIALIPSDEREISEEILFRKVVPKRAIQVCIYSRKKIIRYMSETEFSFGYM